LALFMKISVFLLSYALLVGAASWKVLIIYQV
jgi:hypothetical protein